jgi:predicted HTH transcriptional regulator
MKTQIAQEHFKKIIESQSGEFKSSVSQQKKGFESLTAMVNAETAKGIVIFGIDDDGAIIGIDQGNIDSAQLKLAEHARNKIEPRLVCNIEVLDCEGKTLIAVHAQRQRDIPFHEYDGRAFIREGSSNRQLSFSEKQSLIRGRSRDLHTGPWRCDKCGSLVGMLIGLEITEHGAKKTYRCNCGGEHWPA